MVGKGHTPVFSLLSQLEASRSANTPLQHSLGSLTFAADLCRPLFAVLQASYQAITQQEDSLPFNPAAPTVFELLAPLALRSCLASNQFQWRTMTGGGAAGATYFLEAVDATAQGFVESHTSATNE